MNIIIVSNLFPNPAQPMRGIFLFQMVRELAKKVGVTVVSPLPWVPPVMANRLSARYPYARTPPVYEKEGICIHYPRYPLIPKISGPFHPLLMYPGLLARLEQLVRTRPVDLINAQWIYPEGVACIRAGRRLGLPVILTARGCDINLYGQMPFRASKIRRAFIKADGLSAVSGPLALAMEDLCSKKKRAVVIPNGIDRTLFDIRDKQAAREKLNLPKNHALVVTVGSLDPVKGTASLIRAASLIDRSLILACVGEGPLKPRLAKLAESLGMDGRVLFPGQRPHEEIPLWMNAADVFCLSSLREGHPNVILEAMACGIPVAASNVGGIPEMLPDPCGVLFTPGNIQEIKQRLEHVLSTSWDRGAIRAKTAGFSWSRCADGYVRIYENILAQHGSTE